ncbi:nucleotidyltransferase family protein [Enterobacter chuandaensis]|uniref:Nucleotidyltransferase family protein n=1 Tax=Enterobacter chuandaensis TaxID=2497875 RepID=A0AA96M758_9ENTR|nr:nucleotidyltransferase family protein [Enterobacter chuandaensis]MCW4780979.1 nucleotidyltransferase family protein [Enterobacter chuandaensis]MDA4758831.1 nucleotidyltransferase family protein [Enterobacter chuandaensis]WNS39931.1 nucleotidyltransferase family protein [Enterobacter chuandaensis]
MDYLNSLQRILSVDPARMRVLYAVRDLQLRDCWVGAGFVRDAVWDHMHGDWHHSLSGDVDVVWHDPARCTPDDERLLEKELKQRLPAFDWSVKNQARMHLRNGDNPYHSTENALLYWPETATAVAVRVGDNDLIEVIAPYGLNDLFELRLRPTPAFEREKYDVFRRRVDEKRWLARYPQLQVVTLLIEPQSGEVPHVA